MMLRAAVAPGLLFLCAGVVAGPEQILAAREPVAEGVAAVADARAAHHALSGGPFQPARQRRAVRRVFLAGPAFEDLLLGDRWRRQRAAGRIDTTRPSPLCEPPP